MHTTYSKVNVSLNWKEASEKIVNSNMKLLASQLRKYSSYYKFKK